MKSTVDKVNYLYIYSIVIYLKIESAVDIQRKNTVNKIYIVVFDVDV